MCDSSRSRDSVSELADSMRLSAEESGMWKLIPLKRSRGWKRIQSSSTVSSHYSWLKTHLLYAGRVVRLRSGHQGGCWRLGSCMEHTPAGSPPPTRTIPASEAHTVVVNKQNMHVNYCQRVHLEAGKGEFDLCVPWWQTPKEYHASSPITLLHNGFWI